MAIHRFYLGSIPDAFKLNALLPDIWVKFVIAQLPDYSDMFTILERADSFLEEYKKRFQ